MNSFQALQFQDMLVNKIIQGDSSSNFNPSEQSLEIEQKIFQGFSGVANLKKKKNMDII